MNDLVWVENEFGGHSLVVWPMCSIAGCANRVCVGRSDRYCWPHSGAGKSLDTLTRELRGEKLEETA